MKTINFKPLGIGNHADEGEEGGLVFYRSESLIAGGAVGKYLPEPGTETVYLRVPIREVNGEWKSDPYSLEATKKREMQNPFEPHEPDMPTAVYSCVFVRRARGADRPAYKTLIFYGYFVPESLSETSNYAALSLANVWPQERNRSIAEAEAL